MMDEYIKRNNAISAVCFGCNQQFSDEPCEPCECSIRQSIMALPTADVVPKREVFLASSDAMKMLIECHGYALTHDADIKKEVAREIFEEIDVLVDDWKHSYIQSIQFIAELSKLKKKYTEDKNDKRDTV